MSNKKFKIYLPNSSSLEEDDYLKGSFRITVKEDGQPISVTTENGKLLLVGSDCEVYFEK